MKSLDDIVSAYPWPPLGHEAGYRQLLGFLLSDTNVTDPHFVAYMLGTIRHETAYTFAPVEEWGHGAGHPYGVPDPATGKVYYGRGYVQITWKDNYQRFSGVAGVDLVQNPEEALDPAISYKIASAGMRLGMFTGKKFSDFVLPGGGYDYVNARRIINGLDQAETIAGYALMFYASIA